MSAPCPACGIEITRRAKGLTCGNCGVKLFKSSGREAAKLGYLTQAEHDLSRQLLKMLHEHMLKRSGTPLYIDRKSEGVELLHAYRYVVFCRRYRQAVGDEIFTIEEFAVQLFNFIMTKGFWFDTLRSFRSLTNHINKLCNEFYEIERGQHVALMAQRSSFVDFSRLEK